ncbi:hypothetical protein MKW92_032769 [Papaver armeniacum]|nr:hypothetical protein MKW92_032769 [Papaver armeniacum]
MGIYSSLRKGVGNTLVRIIYGNCFSKPTTISDDDQDYSNISSPDHHVSHPPPPPPTNGVFHLWVPELLSEHVASSKKAQAKWYKKLLKAWKGAKPPPKTSEQASRLVMQTLRQNIKADVEGLLKFYGLPVLDEHQIDIPAVEVFPPPRPEGVKLELHTFPFGFTVYVDVGDPREATLSVPEDVQVAVSERSKARASKDKSKAKALHKTIVDAGYRVVHGPNKKEILARKYQIRLRGIDAPENKQPFGKEAKKELTKLVKGNCVIVHVYGEDKYHRLVGDVYCNGQFAQEVMLKKGLAWHYPALDKRPELKRWHKEAEAAKVGLWASPNPEKPWEWRKNNRREEN